MVALVRAMRAKKIAEPVLVMSNRADAAGLAKAAEFDVPTEVVKHDVFADRAVFEATLSEKLHKHGTDLICLAGFMRILGADFVSDWAGKIINIHPSLLPKYKGLNTHARAIEAGDTEAGCTVHEVTAELDDGPILGQAAVPIRSDDTADSLAARVLLMEHKLYPAVLARIVSGEKAPLILPAQSESSIQAEPKK